MHSVGKLSSPEIAYPSSYQLLYEFFYLFSCSKELAVDYSYSVWQAVDKKWKEKQFLNSSAEEIFFRRDLFCLALEALEKEELSLHFSPSSPFFSKLSSFEFMLLILRDRFLLEKEEIEIILDCSPGSLGLQLMQVREKFSHYLFSEEKTSFSLAERVKCNQILDGSTELPFFERQGSLVKVFSSLYYISLEKVRSHCQWLTVPLLKKEEIQHLFLSSPEKGTLNLNKRSSKGFHAWKHRLLLQGIGLGVLGVLLVVFLSFENTPKPKKEDLSRAIFSVENQEKKADPLPEKFPLGPSYKKGAAHIAPSLQRKTIYRLIVQSENPKEMVPYIKSIFQETKVKEANRSGNAMPGGIYFDGVTQAKNYSKIHKALSRIAPTNAYLNKNKKRVRVNESARVIIWVQQI